MEKKFMPKIEPKVGNLPGLRIIPLGGIGDVTKNMYIYELGNDIVIVDCGLGFPDEAMLGIDLVIPDISYLENKKDRIRGIVITHAHDDHIGGLPYIWQNLGEPPIYAQKLACGFIKVKFTEANLPKGRINLVGLETELQLGAFKISFYQVSHSVPDSVGVVLETSAGRVVHQADFKIDWTPVSGQLTDVGKAAYFGDKGVDLMLIDALRSERSGYNISEKVIQSTFEKIEKEATGKMLVTTTSSNIGRIQQAINVAVSSGRKVAMIGRSMENNFQVARDLGYLDVSPGIMIVPDEIKRYPDNKLFLIIAGAFGQPGSALSRAANNDHRFVTIKPKDSVVFSADPIPSTESAQYALIDKITKIGADVYYTALTDALHVSGHAASEELKLMVNLIRPKYLLPIGATFRQMKAFANMVKEMGWRQDEILLVDDGQVVVLNHGRVQTDGRVEVRNVYIDGLGIGDVGSVVLRDRQVMSEEGIVLVIVPVDSRTSQIAGEPDIVSRGFVFEKQSEELLDQAKKGVKAALADHPNAILDWRFTRHHIEEVLQEFFYKETKRRPLILPVVIEV